MEFMDASGESLMLKVTIWRITIWLTDLTGSVSRSIDPDGIHFPCYEPSEAGLDPPASISTFTDSAGENSALGSNQWKLLSWTEGGPWFEEPDPLRFPAAVPPLWTFSFKQSSLDEGNHLPRQVWGMLWPHYFTKFCPQKPWCTRRGKAPVLIGKSGKISCQDRIPHSQVTGWEARHWPLPPHSYPGTL